MAATSSPFTVLVTGGTGLVGQAIRCIVEKEGIPNENWVYLSSKDGNLWCAIIILSSMPISL